MVDQFEHARIVSNEKVKMYYTLVKTGGRKIEGG